MWKNYLLVALRHLRRQKGYAALNILGLTLGLACCLLIFQYVAYEYSFDAFNEHADDLYRVTLTAARSGEAPEPQALTGYALGPALAEAVPEISHVTRMHPDYTGPIIANPSHPDRVFEEERVYYADPAFFQMFSYPLVAGDAVRALAEPDAVLLSESAARKYFGDENPLGQPLDVTGWIDGSFRVGGVFREVPSNSHLRFDVLLPMAALVASEQYSEPETGWSWNNLYTYVRLRAGADRAAVERKMTEVFLARRGDDFRERGMTAHLSVQPLRDLHLNDEIFAPEAVRGSYRTVYFFSIIGLVTLVIALVNYVNLATARALDRAREVGVRKVVGAQRKQLVGQFILESALTNVVAAALAAALAFALQPVVNDLAGTELTGALWSNLSFWTAALVTFSACTVLAGLYPAFVLSSFRPVAVLKGKTGAFGGQLWLRRGLVVLQFAASVALIGGTAVVYQQLHYMRHLDLGIDLEQVLTVSGPRVLPEDTDGAAVDAFVQELRRLPAVRAVATSSALPGQGFNWYTSSVRQEAAAPTTVVDGAMAWIDTSFAALYGLELVAGRGFRDITPPESDEEPMPVIANESAVRAVGFDTPAKALDQVLNIGGTQARVVGVFRDFNWSSAHEARENAFFALTPGGSEISMKVGTESLPQTIAAVERIYAGLFPGNPFRYAFVDETFDKQYRDDQRFATLFMLFAGLAIGIACLGLFGLAAFTAQQRTKEIGVRKVLGASVGSIVSLLSKDFAVLVFVAFAVATPAAYLLMEQWLERFAYRIPLGPGAFVLAGGLALLLALGTVSYHAIRAATTDPVRALRYE